MFSSHKFIRREVNHFISSKIIVHNKLRLHTAKTQYRKFETIFPEKGIVWPRLQFPHACVSVCERFISQPV